MMRRAQPWLGTLVDIRILDELPPPALHAAFQAAFSVVQEVHECMSFHAADSDISRFNRAAAGDILPLHAHTATVLAAAQRLCEMSAGIFDVRIASRLADYAFLPVAAEQSVPRFETACPAYHLSDQQSIQKLRDDWLDVGGIAKGYAVDKAIAALQAYGIQHACVNAGGDLRVLGTHEIAIRDPQQPERMAKKLQLSDQALATSATYFSQKKHAGEACSALFDARSGDTLQSRHSYSVIAQHCMLADGMTKIIAATHDAQHPCLGLFNARALIV